MDRRGVVAGGSINALVDDLGVDAEVDLPLIGVGSRGTSRSPGSTWIPLEDERSRPAGLEL